MSISVVTVLTGKKSIKDEIWNIVSSDNSGQTDMK